MLQEFTEEVNKTARAAVNNIHTALPGSILEIDTVTGLAKVQPYGKYVIEKGTSADYPALTDVPFVLPFSQFAGAGIAFPVKPGDDCLIIISEVELDSWRSGMESEGPLKFNLTNAVAIPGLLRNAGALIEQANRENAVVVSGNLVVTGQLTAGGINMNTHTHTSGEAGSSTSGPR